MTSLVLFFFFLLCSFSSVNSHSSCLSHNHHQCPPFTSSTPPPYPFSFSPGCGHPSFQLNCSKTNNHSLISINSLTFSLLHFDPNSSSLLLKPTTTTTNCSFSSIPNRPINLSSTPFSFSDASCHRLSVLRPCSPLSSSSSCPTTTNHCHWQCKLNQNPVKLFHGCGSRRTSSLPNQGCQGDVLAYLDSFLQLGIELEWDEEQDHDDHSYFSNCRDCVARTNGVCGYNVSDPRKHFLCLHHAEISPPSWVTKHHTNRVAVLCTVLATTCLMVGVSVLLARSRRFNSSTNEEEDPTAVFLHRHRAAVLLPPVFTYDELEASTDKFDAKRKIGDGGFGSVYLGQLDGRVVAVKYLHHRGPTTTTPHSSSTKAFCNEILILSSIDHPNLVKLHGYCSDPRGLLLVYDYVSNGTLADHLHHHRRIRGGGGGCSTRLTWRVRVDVAVQIAEVMEYLHFSVVPPVVHRDITSSNIFVEKDMRVKVGDFGLSRMLVFPSETTPSDRSGYVWTGPQGTPGYLDPDYYRSFRLTEKSDVYSFGVVLWELISGLKAVDRGREKTELTLADMMVTKIQMGLLSEAVDPVLANEEGVDVVAELAFRCVAAEKDDRPDAREVVEELKRIRSRTRGGIRDSSSSSVIGAALT